MTSDSSDDSPLGLVLPVIDLLGGVVVRGVGGERENYRPIESQIAASSAPADVAAALRKRYGFRDCYVADLDGIVRGEADRQAIAAIQAGGLQSGGLEVWLDAGVGTADDYRRVADRLDGIPISKWIVGLESLADLASLAPLLAGIGSDRLVFSLDLKQGRPLSDHPRLAGAEPLELAREVVELGVQHLILLDLAQVGRGSGTGTDPLLVTLRREFPQVQLITGGGVQNLAQVARQRQLGADRVLMASAVHQGTI